MFESLLQEYESLFPLHRMCKVTQRSPLCVGLPVFLGAFAAESLCLVFIFAETTSRHNKDFPAACLEPKLFAEDWDLPALALVFTCCKGELETQHGPPATNLTFDWPAETNQHFWLPQQAHFLRECSDQLWFFSGKHCFSLNRLNQLYPELSSPFVPLSWIRFAWRLQAGLWRARPHLCCCRFELWPSPDEFCSPSLPALGWPVPRGGTRAGVCWQSLDTPSWPCDYHLPAPSGKPSGGSDGSNHPCHQEKENNHFYHSEMFTS